MTTQKAPFTVRFTHTMQIEALAEEDKRYAFWQPLFVAQVETAYAAIDLTVETAKDPAYWEQKVNRDFGAKLQEQMLQGVLKDLQSMERNLGTSAAQRLVTTSSREVGSQMGTSATVGGSVRSAGSSSAESASSQVGSSSIESASLQVASSTPLMSLEQWQVLMRDVPAYRELINRYARLSMVTIRAKVVGYSSMDVNLAIGGLQHIAQAFNSDFDSFRLFLEGFIAPAFAAVVGYQFANVVQYELEANEALVAEFKRQPNAPKVEPATGNGDRETPGRLKQVTDRARFFWVVANSSLLVPVLLALFICYLAFNEMNAVRARQEALVDSNIAHQQKLLEEDRNRLANFNLFQETIIRDRLGLPTITPVITSTVAATSTIPSTPATNSTSTP